jgi:cytochrome P450/GrpB-like predicted nucleotidyltransferase (UPF0157 family)
MPDLSERMRRAGVTDAADPLSAWQALREVEGPRATLIDLYALAAAPDGLAAHELPLARRQALARAALPIYWPGFSLTDASVRPREPVEISEYDPAWAGRYESWRERIAAALGGAALRIEHVGSTSVPGLAAKPVVDIQVSVADLDAEQHYVPQLETTGVVLASRDDAHRYFRPPAGQPRVVHVHVCPAGSDWERTHLLFRDYLRAHPAARDAYAAVKREAARLWRDDRWGYTEAKAGLILDLLEQAERWASGTGWLSAAPTPAPAPAPAPARPARPDAEVIFDPSTYVDGVPFDALARLRSQHPVVWVAEIPVLGWPAGPGFWLVLRHVEVESVLARPQLFSSARGATQIRDPATPRALRYVRQMMLNMDPPGHSRLRRMLGRSFTPRAVAQLEDRIRGHARVICDRVFTGPRGHCDFATDVAADLPLLTLADVLGVPRQDRWLLFDWSNRVIGYQDADYAASAEFDPAEGTPMARQALALRPVPDRDGRMPDPRTREGMPDLYAYAHLLAQEKRRHPGDDVMSILLAQADDDGGQVSVAEFENMFWLFAVAGNETLRNGLPGACIALLEHPGAQDELRANPALMPAAVEEMLRWWTPVMTFRRTATSGCELGGQRIAEGDKVVVSFISANRDEAVFARPDRFDIRRRPNPHLVFGHGPHFCLGAHLARIQMRALFAEVLARTSGLSYAGEPSYLRSNFQRGVKRLPISWTA